MLQEIIETQKINYVGAFTIKNDQSDLISMSSQELMNICNHKKLKKFTFRPRSSGEDLYHSAIFDFNIDQNDDIIKFPKNLNGIY